MFGKTLVHEFHISYSYTEFVITIFATRGDRNDLRVTCKNLTITIIIMYFDPPLNIKIRCLNFSSYVSTTKGKDLRGGARIPGFFFLRGGGDHPNT